MMLEGDDGDDDNALAVELATLRAAVAQFQQEAHTSALRLQHHFLANANVLERNRSLERENDRLRAELTVLRATPDSISQTPALHTQELTLVLRRVSERLSFTDDALNAGKLELANARSDLVKAKHASDGAFALAAAARAREEEGRVREHDLRHRLHAAEQDRMMSDHVVHEYANLVRSMEGRTSSMSRRSSVGRDITSSANTSSTTLVDTLTEGKSELQKLLESFKTESAGFEADVARLQEELRLCQSHLATERVGSAHDLSELANALVELERLRIDDNTAAKMVSRYMKFSQSTATSLQSSLTALATRHAATQATFLAELEETRNLLNREIQDTTRLRGALDELSADLAREAYGRRREVSLRLALLSREERVCERLRRWMRRSRELAERAQIHDACNCSAYQVFKEALIDAYKILDAVDGDGEADSQSFGQLARMIVAQSAVSMLTEELAAETERRLWLERAMAKSLSKDDNLKISHHPEVDVDKHHVNEDESKDPSGMIEPCEALAPDDAEQALTTSITPASEPPEHTRADDPDRQSSSCATPLSGNESSETSHTHSLLAELARVSERYDDLQHAFRDCHLALQNIRASTSGSPSTSTKANPIIQAAVERLYHYTEDVRVGLEIRVADEALLARGFEALLSIPGAISPSPTDPRFKVGQPTNDNEECQRWQQLEDDIESDIRAFVDGTEISVQKALQRFSARLDDIQHDIAVIKLASHDLGPETQASSLRTERALDDGISGDTNTAVRLDDVPMSRSLNLSEHTAPVLDDGSASGKGQDDPFAQLGLRVPMPRYVHHKPSKRQGARHPRKSSGMYMLGLGMPYQVSENGGDGVPGKSRVWSAGVALRKEELNIDNPATRQMEVE